MSKITRTTQKHLIIVIVMTIALLFALSQSLLAVAFIFKTVVDAQTLETSDSSIFLETSVPEVTDSKNSENWIYPEDVMDALEEKIGYRPEYTVSHNAEGQCMLGVTFYDLEIGFGWPIDTDATIYDGWRTSQADFELNMPMILRHYFEHADVQTTDCLPEVTASEKSVVESEN